MENELIDGEFSPEVSFEEFQKTDRYNELIEESKVNHTHLDEITIVLMIALWYRTDVLKEIVEVVEPPPKITEFDTKQIGVYDPEEHLAKYGDVFKQPLGKTEPQITEDIHESS